MLCQITNLLIIASLVSASGLRAEVEFEFDGKRTIIRKKVEFPILISVIDAQGQPVKGAIVVLEELGMNFSTENEIIREAKTRTDENGMIVVMHPAMVLQESPKSFSIKIQSVVTLVAKGHRMTTVELPSSFKGGLYHHSESIVPHLKLTLLDKIPDPANTKKNAQVVAPNGP
jgi:hypothetical protein